MPRGMPHDPRIRAVIVAEILAGESIAVVARRHGVPRITAQNWWAVDRPVELTNARTQARMVEQLYDAAFESLDGVRATAQLLQDPAWARTQTAAELAQLVGVLSDRTIRMLGGLRPADDDAAPRAQPVAALDG